LKTKKPKIKIKHLSGATLIILVVLGVIKLVNPGFYQDFIQISSYKLDSKATINSNNNIDPNKCSQKQICIAKVTNIVDGDTIDLSTGERVRYIGVDTPETKHPTKAIQCFGKEASEENKKLVLDREVRLEKDVSDKDKYGRLLRYIYIPSENDFFVNDYLARQGFAHAATFPPDVKFSKQFVEAEKEARENGRGLWASGVCPGN